MCGLCGVLSVTVTFAVRTPVAVGVNETLMAQLPPEANVAGPTGQPLEVILKSPALGPVSAAAPKVMGARARDHKG